MSSNPQNPCKSQMCSASICKHSTLWKDRKQRHTNFQKLASEPIIGSIMSTATTKKMFPTRWKARTDILRLSDFHMCPMVHVQLKVSLLTIYFLLFIFPGNSHVTVSIHVFFLKLEMDIKIQCHGKVVKCVDHRVTVFRLRSWLCHLSVFNKVIFLTDIAHVVSDLVYHVSKQLSSFFLLSSCFFLFRQSVTF